MYREVALFMWEDNLFNRLVFWGLTVFECLLRAFLSWHPPGRWLQPVIIWKVLPYLLSVIEVLRAVSPPRQSHTCTLKLHRVNSRRCLLISYKEVIMKIQRSSWFQLLGLNHLLAAVTWGFPSVVFSHAAKLQRKYIKCYSVLMINCNIV